MSSSAIPGSIRFTKKVAIITGAGKGMGKRTALDMAYEGASVIVSDIDIPGMDNTVSEIIEMGGTARGIECDVADREQVDNLINTVSQDFGRIDILINNAGLLLPGTIEETTDEIIDRTLDINVKGILYAIRAVTPIMKRQEYGRIINVASITGKNGDNSTVFVYGGSKGAVISLTRSVARQLGPFGVTCNAIAPHAVMTELMKYWSDEKKQLMADKIPVRRLGTEGDMSNLMRVLASDESSFISGETININGGYYMD
jgi:3-oxoacyl-[acyl-carrier protein] reductase